jgi:hypothetical protein
MPQIDWSAKRERQYEHIKESRHQPDPRGLIQVLLVDADRHPLGVLNARDGLRALLRNYVMGIGYQ